MTPWAKADSTGAAPRPNPESRLVHHPQPALNGLFSEQRSDNGGDPIDKTEQLPVRPQYHNAGSCRRRVADNVSEVDIQGDQDATLRCRRGQDILVGRTGKILGAGRFHIVSARPKYLRGRVRDILIKLEERHYAVIGTIRSRVSSAAYASAAGTASAGSVGYSL